VVRDGGSLVIVTIWTRAADRCPSCAGSGKRRDTIWTRAADPCPSCAGSGKCRDTILTCTTCRGTGHRLVSITVDDTATLRVDGVEILARDLVAVDVCS
jgi:DnaJ-class molecular chaperone